MKIGIIGTGHIGKTLALTLGAAGHEVEVANSRGPETIDIEVLSTEAKAATVQQATANKDVIIISIPLNRIPELAPFFAEVPDETVVIDTSNYYPARDNGIDSIEAGQVESLWVQAQLGRPVAKAWNAIGSDSFAKKGRLAGSPGRIAIPIAADREIDRRVTMDLVGETGFDAFDAGSLAESWRQQPGAPGYCTDLTLEELPAAIASAEKARLPKRRDLAVGAFQERLGDATTNPDADYGVRLSRALFM
ncbi:NADPH-dependent F420 reductase [Rufibacter hautae]|uniref:NADP oxidoreductase n=1 Tax=Rufibacter hautae TaxID=2595005 RepID=A0A5B6TRU9_9BACT|nr:NAD(P)-binding domain-containing protein [Rufibacter hautae]KAA3439248.1 NADP oxidoreductase [Rufibacter hautae]